VPLLPSSALVDFVAKTANTAPIARHAAHVIIIHLFAIATIASTTGYQNPQRHRLHVDGLFLIAVLKTQCCLLLMYFDLAIANVLLRFVLDSAEGICFRVRKNKENVR